MKFTIIACLAIFALPFSSAREIEAEIKAAERMGREMSSLMLRNDIRPNWSDDGNSMVYRVNTTSEGHQYFHVNLRTGAKNEAFDHVKLAEALSKSAAKKVTAEALPLDAVECGKSGVRFRAFDKGWRFVPATGEVSQEDVPPKPAALLSPEDTMRKARRTGGPTAVTFENGTDGEIEILWVAGRGRPNSYGKVAPGKNQTISTYSGDGWVVSDAKGTLLAGMLAKDTPSVATITGRIGSPPRRRNDLSPDEKWRAFIRDGQIVVEPAKGGDAIIMNANPGPNRSFSGPLQWSPDSKKLTAWRVKEVARRKVHIVQTSPPDQVQPKLQTLDYPKPGDEISQRKPLLLDLASRREIPTKDELFDNPWDIGDLEWSADSSEFSFVYNQRGHQLMRIVGIRADSGSARVILEERSKTFIDYSQKTWLHRIPATRELIWASERDGFNHLYLIDETNGSIKKQITNGQWMVREVMEVDDAKRQLLLKVLGVPGQDPYHIHFVRINFDGSGFTRLTESDGHHGIEFSPDGKWILAKWSRVDQPQVVEIRNASNGKLLTELERADDSQLQKKGWSRPERFVSKGRDGKTDIYGIILRPTHFDPAKKYPVVEDIYAGPHDHFVAKNHMTWSGMQSMAELGFIVVNIDGMGTNWRGKAFHDVCWKNLKDSGFPDRIAWIKAAAKDRPWMDLERVGIYGGSAGGQSTLSGLLHHGDFYKVGVADCGCHDNRMDKIWWNEAWMGWPVDKSYEENSNVVHAAKLTGRLMLVVGELDHNVDPASTAQVVAALQKAGKRFDYVPIMNAGHGAAETPYGKYRRAEFLTRELGAALNR